MSVSRAQFKHVYPGASGAFTSTVTVGNTIVVSYSGGGTGTGVTDSLGNTYNLVDTTANGTVAGRVYVYTALVTTGGTCTITVPSLSDIGFTAVEYSGLGSSYTVTSALYSSSSGGSSTKEVGIATVSGGLVFCGWNDESASTPGTITPATGFSQINYDTGHLDAAFDNVSPSTGTTTAGFTSSSANTWDQMVVAAFAPSSADLVSSSDSTTTSESLAGYSDQVITREQLSVTSDENPNVTDSSSTSENLNLKLSYSINVSDSTSTSENISVLQTGSGINVSDATSTSENATVVVPFYLVSVSDSTSTSENIKLLNSEFISVSDSTTTSENVTGRELSFISVTDSTSTSESITAREQGFISVSDSTSTSETLTESILSFISVLDSTTLSESFTPLIPVLYLSVSDSSTTSESIAVFETGNGIYVTDSTSLTENISVYVPFEAIYVSDSTTTSENYNQTLVSLVSVFDGTIPIEGRYNYIVDGSFEAAQPVSGLNITHGQAGTPTGLTYNLQDPTYSLFGSYSASYQQAPAGQYYLSAALNGGSTGFAPVFGVTYTFSAYVYIPIGSTITQIGIGIRDFVTYNYIIRPNGGTGEVYTSLTPGQWTRVSYSAVGGSPYTVGGAPIPTWRFAIADAQGASTPQTWYVDGVMLEASTTVGTYFDGSNAGQWSGTANQSSSFIPSWNAEVDSLVSVSDSTSTSELYLEEMDVYPVVSDSTSISESINTSGLSTLSVSDSTSTSENVSENAIEFISVSDSTSTSENINLINIGLISVSDSTTLSESLKFLNSEFISVADNTSTSESFKEVIPVYYIQVNDSTVTSEVISLLQSGNGIYASDGSSVTETVNVYVPFYNSNISDSTNTSENVNVSIANQINVSDTSFARDDIGSNYLQDVSYENASLPADVQSYWNGTLANSTAQAHTGVQSLSVTTTESVHDDGMIHMTPFSAPNIPPGQQVLTSGWFWVPNGVSLHIGSRVNDHLGNYKSEDNASATIVGNSAWQYVQLSPYSVTSDSLGTINGLDSHVSTPASGITYYVDDVSLTYYGNNGNIQVSYAPSVSDSTTLSENITSRETVSISVSDSTTTSESLTVLEKNYVISVTDSSSTSENLRLSQLEFISTQDSTATSETININLVNRVLVADSTSTSETNKELLISNISVGDTSALVENVLIGTILASVLVSENISLSESLNVSQVSFISVQDSINHSEVLNFEFITYYSEVHKVILQAPQPEVILQVGTVSVVLQGDGD